MVNYDETMDRIERRSADIEIAGCIRRLLDREDILSWMSLCNFIVANKVLDE